MDILLYSPEYKRYFVPTAGDTYYVVMTQTHPQWYGLLRSNTLAQTILDLMKAGF